MNHISYLFEYFKSVQKDSFKYSLVKRFFFFFLTYLSFEESTAARSFLIIFNKLGDKFSKLQFDLLDKPVFFFLVRT